MKKYILTILLLAVVSQIMTYANVAGFIDSSRDYNERCKSIDGIGRDISVHSQQVLLDFLNRSDIEEPLLTSAQLVFLKSRTLSKLIAQKSVISSLHEHILEVLNSSDILSDEKCEYLRHVPSYYKIESSDTIRTQVKDTVISLLDDNTSGIARTALRAIIQIIKTENIQIVNFPQACIRIALSEDYSEEDRAEALIVGAELHQTSILEYARIILREGNLSDTLCEACLRVIRMIGDKTDLEIVSNYLIDGRPTISNLAKSTQHAIERRAK